MQELFANYAESTIQNVGGITSTGTSITLATGEGARFPPAVTGTAQFQALLVDATTGAILEYLTVTNRSTDTLTVTREAEEATRFPKAARAQGVKVIAVITAAALARIAVPAGAGGPGKALISGSADYDQAWTTPNWGGGDYFRSGYYSPGAHGVPADSGLGFSLNALRARPFIVPIRRAFDRIGINVSTAATAASGSVTRLGIYGPGGGIPGTLLLDAGTVSNESTGAKEITISQTLDPGIYWLAAVVQVATASSQLTGMGTFRSPFSSGTTTPIGNIDTTGGMAGVSGISGALPSTPTWTISGSNSCPYVSLRAA